MNDAVFAGGLLLFCKPTVRAREEANRLDEFRAEVLLTLIDSGLLFRTFALAGATHSSHSCEIGA
jgi:hypothetical protein